MRLNLLFALLIVSTRAFAITCQEANNVAEKYENAFLKSLGQKSIKPTSAPSKALSRTYAIERLAAVRRRFVPFFELTPIPAPLHSSTNRAGLSKALVSEMESLVKGGFLPRTLPLVTKDVAPTDEAFGEALGFVLTRVADLVHATDPKFSPYLAPPEG